MHPGASGHKQPMLEVTVLIGSQGIIGEELTFDSQTILISPDPLTLDEEDDVMLSASSIADENSISLEEKEKKADLRR